MAKGNFFSITAKNPAELPIFGKETLIVPNRLAAESSPYLLQHAENPVDWYPWCEAAFSRAREEDRPIFLSIGYSACHWCHVMERESFEDPEIARFLNDHFVSIKVDREERPDLDQIYMQSVMALQRGQGGWPLSAFLTPEGHVFFGGTYWPPHDSRGMPGFDRVLKSVLDAFRSRRSEVDSQSKRITEYVNQGMEAPSDAQTDRLYSADILQQAGEGLHRIFDFHNGGFGRAPKFPHAMDLQLLLRLDRDQIGNASDQGSPNEQDSAQPAIAHPWREMVESNLTAMALGGIYDHVGGGFARYSVDEKWLVPHFEKMLYDNALLTNVYLDAYCLTGKDLYRQVTQQTFDYQLRDMTDPAGAFYSTEDADSEGVEGKFYVWERKEIDEVLGEDSERFCRLFGVTETGNFEGHNILHLKKPLSDLARELGEDSLESEMASCLQLLFAARSQRVRPARDDKVLTGWNALMIHSLARGGRILKNRKYLQAAVKAAEFIETNLCAADGKLLHTWRNGTAKTGGFLEDYANYIQAVLTLLETTGQARWLRRAIQLAEIVIDEFHAGDIGGFYFTGKSAEQLVARVREFQDSSVPSGNSMMVNCLIQLQQLTGKDIYRELAEQTVLAAWNLLERAPSAAGQMLCGVHRLISPSCEVVVASNPQHVDGILEYIHQDYHPNRIVVVLEPENGPAELAGEITAGRTRVDGQPTVYVCENRQCKAPLVGLEQIRCFFEEGNGSNV